MWAGSAGGVHVASGPGREVASLLVCARAAIASRLARAAARLSLTATGASGAGATTRDQANRAATGTRRGITRAPETPARDCRRCSPIEAPRNSGLWMERCGAVTGEEDGAAECSGQ